MNVNIEAEQLERECLLEIAEEVIEDLEAFLTRHFTPVQMAALRLLSLAPDYEVRDLPVKEQEQLFARRRQWATLDELRIGIEGRLWALDRLVALFPADPATQPREANDASLA